MAGAALAKAGRGRNRRARLSSTCAAHSHFPNGTRTERGFATAALASFADMKPCFAMLFRTWLRRFRLRSGRREGQPICPCVFICRSHCVGFQDGEGFVGPGLREKLGDSKDARADRQIFHGGWPVLVCRGRLSRIDSHATRCGGVSVWGKGGSEVKNPSCGNPRPDISPSAGHAAPTRRYLAGRLHI